MPSPPPAERVAAPKGVERQSASETLYHELVQECERCFRDAQTEPRLSLGHLPALVEELVEAVVSHDAELQRLSFAGDGSTLAHHGVNVAILATSVAAEQGLKQAQLAELALAALLHDLGMADVAHLVQRPDQLDPTQLAQVREHPLRSAQLLQRCPDLPPLAFRVALEDHERIDGSGYPHRLQHGGIHKQAQLVGLLDVYESLTHDRPHRKRLIPFEAMRMIVQEFRAVFDSDLLRAFLNAVPIYPVGSWVQLNNGEMARVTASDRRAPLAPVVTTVLDRHGDPLTRPTTVDLAREPLVSILHAVPEPLSARA